MFNIHFSQKVPIHKGWSGDRKYCATDDGGRKYLLRISPVEQYERKKRGFAYMEKIAALNIPMCRPLAFGTSDEGVYSVQSWIEGMDAEECVPGMSGEDQYAYGREAGKILQKIHRLPAPGDTEDWASFFNRKADRKLEMYRSCPIKCENGQAFIDCISANRHLLKGRPSTYQHGDYHIGNMMIGDDKRLYIIDFDRSDFGDPWEEFNRIVWCAQAAPLFATGMVNGYFDGDVPIEFWRLLALYISSNMLASVAWAIPFGQQEIDVMRNQTKDVLKWYDNMQNTIPAWYAGILL